METIEQKFLQYFNSTSKEMMKEDGILETMAGRLREEMKTLSLNVEQRVQMLSQLYAQEAQYINSEAVKAALALLQEDRNDELADAQLLTEERKRQGYDDNVLIELMKAQGSLASFAVNANSDTAQDTIDDLKVIMKVVEDRVCDLVCDTPSFNLEYTTQYDTPLNGNVFGGSDLTYAVAEQPALGTLVVNQDGSFIYTPQNDTDGIGIITFKIKTTDDVMSVITSVTVAVTDITGA
jgi:hypothetical protein